MATTVSVCSRCAGRSGGGLTKNLEGYIFTFAVTAAMQTTGSCMQFLLLPLVEAEPQPKPQPKPESTGERAPLLGGARSDGDEGSEGVTNGLQ